MAAIRELSEVDRELLLLTAWEDLDIRSAALAVGLSRGATAVRLHRARRKLRQLMEQTQPADEPGHPADIFKVVP